MTLSRAVAILLAASVLAGCSVERLPVSSVAPPTRTAGPTPSFAPEPAFGGLPDALAHRVLRSVDESDGEWLFGSLADGWQPLGLARNAASVDDVWGRITVLSPIGGQIVVSTPTAAGGLQELYRTSDGADASADASFTPDGAALLVFNTSLGVRHVDLATAEATEIFAPGAFFAGPTTTGRIDWSPTGRLLIYVVCDMETCHSQVADRVRPSVVVDDMVPGAIAGHWLIGYERDGNKVPLLLDLETGQRRRVAPAIDTLWDAIAVSESRFLLWGISERRFNYVLLDLADGTDRLLATGPHGSRPSPELSTEDWALLSPQGANVWVSPGESLSVLDFASGRIVEDVIQVPPAP